MGAGYIAVEMAGILNALGSEVSLGIRHDEVRRGRHAMRQLSRADQLCHILQFLRPFDGMIRSTLAEEMAKAGVKIVQRATVREGCGGEQGDGAAYNTQLLVLGSP